MNESEAMEMVARLMRPPAPVKRGLRVYAYKSEQYGLTTGGTRRCQMESCGGTRIGVRWPDGKMTWPCTKGMTEEEDGWHIQ